MFKVRGNELLFKGKYGYMRINKLTHSYFIYGSGCLQEINHIKQHTYFRLSSLIRRYNIELQN